MADTTLKIVIYFPSLIKSVAPLTDFHPGTCFGNLSTCKCLLWIQWFWPFSHLLYWSADCLFFLYDFHSLTSSILMPTPTALLICMENTFWHTSRDGNFVELFKKSFNLYVESRMRKKVEADINDLNPRNDLDFKAKFYIFIIEHYLCKIHCFLLHSTYLTTFFT